MFYVQLLPLWGILRPSKVKFSNFLAVLGDFFCKAKACFLQKKLIFHKQNWLKVCASTPKHLPHQNWQIAIFGSKNIIKEGVVVALWGARAAVTIERPPTFYYIFGNRGEVEWWGGMVEGTMEWNKKRWNEWKLSDRDGNWQKCRKGNSKLMQK